MATSDDLGNLIVEQVKAGNTVTFSPDAPFDNMVKITVGTNTYSCCPDASLLSDTLKGATNGGQ